MIAVTVISSGFDRVEVSIRFHHDHRLDGVVAFNGRARSIVT